MINIGLIGFGNVGQGVYDILDQNGDMISGRIGSPISIKRIVVRSPEKYQDKVPSSVSLSADVNDILDDPDIQIVVEVIGGEFPAYDIITKALQNKKFVVTANKEVMSKHKKEFFKLAKENAVDIYFEAAVGGGIPIIRSLKVGFAANKINAFYGIVNGTTNYILTKIAEEKKSFDAVLKTAQELGFAEADPTMDVSGLDAAYKCTILAAVAFKLDVQLDDIYYEGIENISLKDIEYAKELGYHIKLLSFGKRDANNHFELFVYPALIPEEHPLANVRNEFNATYIVGDHVDESMLLGKGAGAAPTGSAVVSDIIDISFGLSQSVSFRNLETLFISGNVRPFEDTASRFFLRLLVSDQAGTLEKITAQFSAQSVNIENIIQKEHKDQDAEVVIVTQSLSEKHCDSLIKRLEETAEITRIISKIRVHKL